MSNKQIKLFTGILYSIAAVMALAGAFFYIFHNPIGLLLFIIGIVLGTIADSFKIAQLKKRIKELEKKQELKEC